jgi:hypothetical protein
MVTKAEGARPLINNHAVKEASRTVQDTDVFRTLRSANSAPQRQQLTAVLAERFFEQCPKGSEAPTLRLLLKGKCEPTR